MLGWSDLITQSLISSQLGSGLRHQTTKCILRGSTSNPLAVPNTGGNDLPKPRDTGLQAKVRLDAFARGSSISASVQEQRSISSLALTRTAWVRGLSAADSPA